MIIVETFARWRQPRAPPHPPSLTGSIRAWPGTSSLLPTPRHHTAANARLAPSSSTAALRSFSPVIAARNTARSATNAARRAKPRALHRRSYRPQDPPRSEIPIVHLIRPAGSFFGTFLASRRPKLLGYCAEGSANGLMPSGHGMLVMFDVTDPVEGKHAMTKRKVKPELVDVKALLGGDSRLPAARWCRRSCRRRWKRR